MSGATLVVYVLLVLRMIQKRLRSFFKSTSSNVKSKEKSILLYAMVKIICDSSLAVLYQFRVPFLPPTLWVEAILMYSRVWEAV
ncbi:hypothetical protein L596_019435 [Steinernema carpocapsae]|uniref:Uncharacterized protein n=1 Tax=Steinernema carpocapsae TaxID=34508 RepID=A0A4U5MRD4_STECR|nr:hypothetical protein L596_019435 [Steinernema carpocapsae]